jgi:hypothetical protein
VNSATVLLVHPSDSIRDALGQVLAAEYPVLSAASCALAANLAGAESSKVVIAQASSSREDFAILVERIPNASFVLLSSSSTTTGGATSAENELRTNQTVLSLPEDSNPALFLQQVRRLVTPRSSSRFVPIKALQVSGKLANGTNLRAQLLDISNRWIGLWFSLKTSLEVLLPGNEIHQLTLERDGQTVLTVSKAVVRRIGLLNPQVQENTGNLGGYRIALEFLKELSESNALPEPPILDRVRKIALIHEGARHKALTLQLGDDASVPTPVKSVKPTNNDSICLVVQKSSIAWQPGDVARGTFNLEGRSYSFLTSVTGIESPLREGPGNDEDHVLHLAQPRSISRTQKRSSNRYRPLPDRPVTVGIRLPFSDEDLEGPILDMSTSGFSIAVDYAAHVLPVGSILRGITLFKGSPNELKVSGRVRVLVPLGENESPISNGFRCGIEIDGLSLQDRGRFAELIMTSGFPGVEDAFGLSFDEVWNFLHETNFIYPEKEEKLRPFLPEIKNTFETLLTKPNRVSKTLIFREKDALQGHLSAVKAYQNTWIIQHLATRKEGRGHLAAARMLNQGVIEYLGQNQEIEWLKSYFRPDNRFPARVFGGFVKKVKDPTVCELRTYNYLVAKSTSDEIAPHPGIEIRGLLSEDLPRIEKHFLADGRITPLRADDLVGGRLLLDSTQAEYRALGLERRREVIVATSGGRMIGFALLEISSLGLNLSELTNAFSVFMRDVDPVAKRALVQHARNRYWTLGRAIAVGLSEDNDLTAFESSGFTRTKSYMCWTWHRSLCRRYIEYVGRLFGRDVMGTPLR